MKKAVISIVLLLGCLVTSTAQKPSLELTFTAIDSATHIQLDSIKVMNRSQGGDTVIYYPDTVLVLDYSVGVEEVDDKEGGLRVYQNYPNPVVESTTVSIYVPEKGFVRCLITDIMGRMVHQNEEVLESGVHSFTYTPSGGEMSFFTAVWQDSRETIKILHPTHSQRGSASLSYLGLSSAPEYEMKAFEEKDGFSFSLGDTLLYIGYVSEMESGMLDNPVASDTLYFQFATNIPCPGTPTVTYEGQVYNTIQIFSQCWLKENLNVGEMISGDFWMTNNGIIEKYCYNNESDSCTVYGGLYQWDEMMQYAYHQGVRGICPQGWHIPSGEEWSVLEGSVDSFYGIGDTIWDIEYGVRGFDGGTHLKSLNGWSCWAGNQSTDKYGFCGLPSGIHEGLSLFIGNCSIGIWWTPHPYEDTFIKCRSLGHSVEGIFSEGRWADNGLSVRCIKD